MKDILKTVVVLTLIAIIAGGMLGIVNSFTQVDNSNISITKLDGIMTDGGYTETITGYTSIMNARTGLTENSDFFDTFGAVKKAYKPLTADGELDGVFIMWLVGYNGYNDDIEILALFDSNTNKVESIAKQSNKDTPGLGSNATESSYLNQFIGLDISDITFILSTSRNPNVAEEGEIAVDGVTSATYSSRAVLNAINAGVRYFNNYKIALNDSSINGEVLG